MEKFIFLSKVTTKKDKFEIQISKILAVLQGLTIPIMIYFLGEIVDIFISFATNRSLKSFTGINNDYILNDLIVYVLSKKSNGTAIFTSTYPNVDVEKILSKIKNSKFSKFKFGSTGNNYEFKTVNVISKNLHKYLFLLGITGIISFLLTVIFIYLLKITAIRRIAKLRSIIFKSFMSYSIDDIKNENPNMSPATIVSKLLIIEKSIGPSVGYYYVLKTVVWSCVFVSIITEWKLTFFIHLSVFLITNIDSFAQVLSNHFIKDQYVSLENLNNITTGFYSRIKTIVSYGKEQKAINDYNKNIQKEKRVFMNKYFEAIYKSITLSDIYLVYIVAFYLGGKYIYNGSLTGGKVIQILLYITSYYMSYVMEEVLCDGLTQKARVAGMRIEREYNNRKLKCLSEIPDGITTENGIDGNIEFRDVYFSYEDSNPVLNGISFKCEYGQKIAIVGDSGSGKSTIFQLLEGFYKAQGSIYIDNNNVNDYDLDWLRSQIGFVPQEPVLFEMTVSENIAITNPGVSQKEIEYAAKLANIHDCILNLPKGYDTFIDGNGGNLSDSQKQRICIARALIKNPKLLMIDELSPFTLDRSTEKAIQNILKATFPKTIIYISHCLDSLKYADHILIMDKGIIVESGSPEELMTKQDIFYNRIIAQDLSYVDISSIHDGNSNLSFNSFINLIDRNDSSMNLPSEASISLIPHYKSNSRINDLHSSTTFSNKHKSNKTLNNNFKIKWSRILSYYRYVWLFMLFGVIGSIMSGCMETFRGLFIAGMINIFSKQDDDLERRSKDRCINVWFIVLVLFISLLIMNVNFILSGVHLNFILIKERFSTVIKQGVDFFNINHMNNDLKKNDEMEKKMNSNDSENNNNNTKSILKKNIKNYVDNKNNNDNTIYNKEDEKYNFVPLVTLFSIINCNIGYMIIFISSVVCSFIFAYTYSKPLTLKLILFAPIIPISCYLKVKAFNITNDERNVIFYNSERTPSQYIAIVKTIYALGLKETFNDIYQQKMSKRMKRLKLKSIIYSIGCGVESVLAISIFGIGSYYGFMMLKEDKIEILNMFIVIVGIIFSLGPINKLCSYNTVLFDTHTEAFNNILKIIDHKPRIDTNDPSGMKDIPFYGKISFKNINFKYPFQPDISVLHLEREQLEIPEGKTLAIIGDSKSGKSIFFDLLLRFYDVEQGEVLLDGRDIKEYNIQWLREQIGIVDTNPDVGKAFSIQDEIGYGKDDPYDEEIIEAAKKTKIYNKMIKDQGISENINIEGKIRVVLSRALIRRPKILLIDNIAAKLDHKSTKRLKNVLDKNIKNCTTIITSEGLPPLSHVDMYIIMKHGRIIEKGTHQELMSMQGEYYKMVMNSIRKVVTFNFDNDNNESSPSSLN